MPIIKQLDNHLVNQIAAGEVIDRPASIIKELLENSLDAEATKITVDVIEGGMKSITVRDNGKGIAADDLPLALASHATSKIANLYDLEHVLTMGFRGEALASIAAVSRLKIISRTAEADNAWQITNENVVTAAAHPVGTTIEVRDLFFNIPARKRFLKTEKTEFAHVADWFKRLAGLSAWHFPALMWLLLYRITAKWFTAGPRVRIILKANATPKFSAMPNKPLLLTKRAKVCACGGGSAARISPAPKPINNFFMSISVL